MIEIRQAGPADAETIIGFQRAMAVEVEDTELPLETITAGVEAELANPDLGPYWLAEIGGEIAGCMQITPEWSDWRNGTIWWIQSVYVRPEFRGRGVFKRLFSHVKRMVADNDAYRGLRLYVDKRNERAQRVYEKLGMDGEHYRMYEWLK